ncbi:MAG TPA: oligopeptide/dipeptide ABC transporter ATP-binding protein [Pseudonocardiaceae bacterium]|jgi:oligopeptide/dipeptide ABC transporter ATP-binding protein
MSDEILSVEGVSKHFTSSVSLTDRLFGTKPVVNRAVDGVNLVLRKGETLGLVGESGCGKSTLARTIVGLYRPNAGTVRYAGAVLPNRRTGAQHRAVQMVFQDPYSSLNPRMTVGQTLGELLRFHQLVPRNKVVDRCRELMNLVGLPDSALAQRPRQFSGGQRQRIGIARALAVEPTVLIADEPVSALDVSVQATIINLLSDLKRTLDLSMIFVSHNMAVVRQICDRTSVMYLGRIVETGVTDAVFDSPVHPYTQLLLKSVPRLGVPAAPQGETEGVAIDVPAGAHPCRFLDRCPAAVEGCAAEPALLPDPADPLRAAACVHVPWRANVIEELA